MKWGRKINTLIYKIMSTENGNIYINGEILENVIYFVTNTTVTNTTDSNMFWHLKDNIWGRSNVSNKFKVRLYNALVLPIAIYGSWILKTEDSRRLPVFENDCLRQMQDTEFSIWVRNYQGLNDIKKKRLQWFENMIIKGDDSYVYRVYSKNKNSMVIGKEADLQNGDMTRSVMT